MNGTLCWKSGVDDAPPPIRLFTSSKSSGAGLARPDAGRAPSPGTLDVDGPHDLPRFRFHCRGAGSRIRRAHRRIGPYVAAPPGFDLPP